MSVVKASLCSAAIFSAAISAGCYAYNFERYPPIAELSDGTLARHSPEDMKLCFSARLASATDRKAAHAWRQCEAYLSAHSSVSEFKRDFGHTITFGAGAAAAFAGLLGLSWIGDRQARQIRGPRKYQGREAKQRLAHALSLEARRSGKGLGFPPGCHLSRDRESRHFMITGGVGAGKTQAMRHLILEAMRRGDHVLVLDTKGDMTAGIPGGIVLLAPQVCFGVQV